MKYLSLISLLLLSACVKAPNIIVNKGAVYGVLSADSHTAIKQKMSDEQDTTSDYSTGSKRDSSQHSKVDYSQLDELYVGLVLPAYTKQQHRLIIYPDKIRPSSLALSPGDELQIKNQSSQAQDLFISEINGEGFQSLSVIQAGQSAIFTVKLEGDLELLAESNTKESVILFSKKNMWTQKVSSGDQYQFEHLTPGDYPLIFWYWRLGKIEQIVTIKQQENVRIDTVLSVDRIIGGQAN